MTSRLLLVRNNVIALPAFAYSLQERTTEGLCWDQEREEIVIEAVNALNTLPDCGDVNYDSTLLKNELKSATDEVQNIETNAVFGGCLIRHFGHFCHESLSRLWWLASGDNSSESVKDICLTLREMEADVYFFMPRWLDDGKDLLPYMNEILAGLGLSANRIRIIDRPVRFSRLLIPAQIWGFNLSWQSIDHYFCCNSRNMMMSLFANFQPKITTEISFQSDKIFVTRSGLPLHLGRLIGDLLLDHMLASAGYYIFYPEKFSIKNQINVFSKAKNLVFIDGSSLYLLWFSRLHKSAKISVILRRKQGMWICDKVRELLPNNCSIEWLFIDELIGENVTSLRDWESHNVVNLGNIVYRLTGNVSVKLSDTAHEALSTYVNDLVSHNSSAQLSGILHLLISSLAIRNTDADLRPYGFLKRAKRKLGSWKRCFITNWGFLKKATSPAARLKPSSWR